VQHYKTMFLKIHKSYRTVVAICDTDLIEKRFEEGNRQLDLRENFYKDKQITHKEAVKLILFQFREDATFNIVGKKAIAAAIEARIITERNVAYIAGIPFTLIF